MSRPSDWLSKSHLHLPWIHLVLHNVWFHRLLIWELSYILSAHTWYKQTSPDYLLDCKPSTIYVPRHATLTFNLISINPKTLQYCHNFFKKWKFVKHTEVKWKETKTLKGQGHFASFFSSNLFVNLHYHLHTVWHIISYFPKTNQLWYFWSLERTEIVFCIIKLR